LRDFVLWATAVLFLLAALYTVTVRREVYEEARRIGALEHRLREQRRRNENASLRRETLASPAALLERARAMGLVDEPATARGGAPGSGSR
jgi:cell division protein FtsL